MDISGLCPKISNIETPWSQSGPFSQIHSQFDCKIVLLTNRFAILLRYLRSLSSFSPSSLSGFKCRCGGLYCGLHRYTDKHNCTFDYKAAGRKELEVNNPKVVAAKVQRIWQFCLTCTAAVFIWYCVFFVFFLFSPNNLFTITRLGLLLLFRKLFL